MDSLYRFRALLLADLLERVRARSFWLVIAISMWLTWLCFPPVNADYFILGINGHMRAFYSSTWIGMVVAMLSLWLSLIGFYLVRGTLTRDIDTKVWELLEVTPLSRISYLLAKWCSHLIVLGVIVAAQLAVGLLVQFVRAEISHVDLIELIKPSIILGLPSLALTGAFAIVFDMVPALRRSVGNVVYFLTWLAILICAAVVLDAPHSSVAESSSISDPRGMFVFSRAAHEVFPHPTSDSLGFCLGCGLDGERPRLFHWSVWQVDGHILAGRLAWLLLAIAIVILCAPFLNRFAAHARTVVVGNGTSSGGRRMAWLDWALKPLQYTPLGTMVAAELKVTLRPRKIWWWLALIAAAAVPLVAPPMMVAYVVIAAWVLLMDIYAHSALREIETRTTSTVFSSPHASGRVLVARWLMLLLLGSLAAMPATLHLIVISPLVALAILAVAASLASWALALGALTRNAHSFELLLCLLAYLGLQELPLLHVVVAPQWTVLAHFGAMPVAMIALWIAWPRLHGVATF